jgi:protein TonB
LFTKLLYPPVNAYFLESGQRTVFSKNPYGVISTRHQLSWFAFGLIAIAHITVLYALHNNKPQPVVPETPPKPIMVSLFNDQPAIKSTPKSVSVANPAPNKPVTSKPKENKTKKAQIKPDKRVPAKTATLPVVERNPTNESQSMEKSSNTSDQPESASAPAVHAPSNTKASNAETKYQAPSFNAGYLHNPPPKYPAMSRRLGEQGRILLRVMVSADGAAVSVALQASSGSSRLDEAALDAVRRWRFVPAKRGVQAVSASVVVPIKFSLGG